jgi:hypothetical protein
MKKQRKILEERIEYYNKNYKTKITVPKGTKKMNIVVW